MPTPRIDLDIVYHVDNLADDSSRFKQAAEWVARQYGLTQLSASVSIVDDPTIHRLNRDHLDHDWPTDVISFVFESGAGKVVGEVIASSDTALRLYQAAGWELADEIMLYVVHGLLHLAGLNDIDESQSHEMRLAEEECLFELGISQAKHHVQRWQNISY